jgi:hypothetical protein
MGRADFDERSRVASLPGKNFFTTKTPRKDKADFEQEETEVTEKARLSALFLFLCCLRYLLLKIVFCLFLVPWCLGGKKFSRLLPAFCAWRSERSSLI